MYKLTLILFSFFSLVFPILAVPMPVPNEIDGLAQRDGSYNGEGTVYSPGPGACGNTNSNDQFVVAIPADIYGNGAHCGHQVNIVSGGTSTQATVVDKCASCGPQDIAMSPATFQKLTGNTAGEVSVGWSFV